MKPEATRSRCGGWIQTAGTVHELARYENLTERETQSLQRFPLVALDWMSSCDSLHCQTPLSLPVRLGRHPEDCAALAAFVQHPGAGSPDALDPGGWLARDNRRREWADATARRASPEILGQIVGRLEA